MSTRRVFFDVSALPDVGKAVTGISRVVLSLIKHMAQEHPDVTVHGISFRPTDTPYRLWSLTDIISQAGGLLDTIASVVQQVTPLKDGDCVLLLGEQWLFPATVPALESLKVKCGVQVFSLLHDMVPFFMPELYWDGFPASYKACITDLVRVSDGLLVYSESTRKDVLHQFPHLNAGSAIISTIKLGDSFDIEGEPRPPLLPEGVKANNYVLCVGTIQPRKNHLLLLSVWRRLWASHAELCPPLLLVGKTGWHVGDLMYFLSRSPTLQKKIHILEQVSDQELQWLYKNSLFSVYPSLYEGWGLPIGESLSASRLCLSSNSSSMPEVGGDLVEYFSPYDSGELFRLIEKYMAAPSLLQSKESDIRKRFIPTSWSNTTVQIVAATKGVQLKACDSKS